MSRFTLGHFDRLVFCLLPLALAWSIPAAAEDPLDVPPPLAPVVDFWFDVFTCYTVDDIVLHDEENPERILRLDAFPVDVLPRSSAGRRHVRGLERRQQSRYHDAYEAFLAGEAPSLTARELAFLDAGRHLVDPPRTEAEEARRLSRAMRSQQGLREVFAESYRRSGLYMDEVRGIVLAAGLPEALAYLPHLESGFNHRAGSHAGARGLWQFTHGTGRQYLTISSLADERLDPTASTHAAVSYLLDAYDVLGTWPLALTAYNYGLNGMRRAVRDHGHDIVCVLEHHQGRLMGFASRNFYVSFVAAARAMKHAAFHYPEVSPLPTWPHTAVTTAAFVDLPGLARHVGVDPDSLSRLNPGLGRVIWSRDRWVPPGTRLRLPPDTVSWAEASWPEDVVYPKQRVPRFHRIRRGETLSAIASMYRTSVRTLSRLNALDDPHRIRAGQVLELPHPN